LKWWRFEWISRAFVLNFFHNNLETFWFYLFRWYVGATLRGSESVNLEYNFNKKYNVNRRECKRIYYVIDQPELMKPRILNAVIKEIILLMYAYYQSYHIIGINNVWNCCRTGYRRKYKRRAKDKMVDSKYNWRNDP
jgi:hypothetical protein